jgi:hypothetical protein
MISGMSDANSPEIEIVPDVLFEKRGQGWLFEVATNGALSYLSADGRLGWRSLAPAAAIAGSLHRGQLTEWRADAGATELTLSWRYPRQPVTETMTIRLREGPAAMTAERVLHNAGPIRLRVHEVRMLAVDGGGVLFADHPPADLRCVYLSDIRKATQRDAQANELPVMPLPQLARIFGDSQECPLPALTVCDAAMQTFLLEASLQQDVFMQMWQMKARQEGHGQASVLAEYAAIARDSRMQPLLLAGGEQRRLSSLFYQVKTGCDLSILYDDCLAELNRQQGRHG